MAIGKFKDVESVEIKNKKKSHEDLEQPFLGEQGNESFDKKSGSIWMVLLCTFVAVCGSFEFGSCVGFSAPTQISIREDLNLSLAQYSIFGSILTIGAMLGAITSGRIADFIGRKGAMRISAISCLTGWLCVYFANEATSLDIGRFFTGFGIGIFSYVVPIFIAEIAPKNLRGGLTTLNQLMIVLGASLAFVAGTIITWRKLALIGIVPCVVQLFGLFFIPESPRWLAKVANEKEFQNALRRLRGKGADTSKEAEEIQVYIETLQTLPRAKMVDLFHKQHFRSVIIGVGLMVFQQFVGINGIGFYASQTFAEAGYSFGKVGTIAYACVQVPITVIGAILMDKSGRRPLILVSASGIFVACLLTGSSFYLKANGLLLDWTPIIAVSGVVIYIAFFSIGMGPVPWLIMTEIFPIHMKGIGGSLVVLVNWSGAWAVSYSYNFLMTWSSYGTYFIYAGFSIFTLIFVTVFVPETKGKTLEEIQACINNDKRRNQVLG